METSVVHRGKIRVILGLCFSSSLGRSKDKINKQR